MITEFQKNLAINTLLAVLLLMVSAILYLAQYSPL